MNQTSEFEFCDFAHFISRYLPGKLQKLTVNAGLSCPNRDGTKGYGGCSYCNNSSFSPGFSANPEEIGLQLEKGKQFFARKYPNMRYLAYFQSYTGSHGATDRLMSMYRQTLGVEGIDGIIIGTRPDCMPQDLLEELGRLGKERFVMVEYGAESSHDTTLQRVNRCHSWADTADAVHRTAAMGIPVGLHLIMGLPGESRRDMLATIDAVNTLPVDIIKCHQLQLIRGTRLCREVEEGVTDVHIFSVEEYVDLCCDIIRRIRKDIAIERFVSQSPDNLLVAPRWGLKNYEFMHLLRRRLRERVE